MLSAGSRAGDGEAVSIFDSDNDGSMRTLLANEFWECFQKRKTIDQHFPGRVYSKSTGGPRHLKSLVQKKTKEEENEGR